jgi:hypothetical protein
MANLTSNSTVNPTRYWSPDYASQRTPDGHRMYWFSAEGTTLDSPDHSFAVEGSILYADNPNEIPEGIFTEIPEEVENPAVQRQVFEQWLKDCSHRFVKPPTIEQCLAHTQTIWDSNAPVAVLEPNEEQLDWTIIWLPTKIKVDSPVYQVYWAPTTKKKPTARIPEDEVEDQESTGQIDIELQGPERIYTLHTRPTDSLSSNNSSQQQTTFLQELKDIQLPLSDSPPLRLEGDFDVHREKLRRRVREARIRAKLARYRAERLAQHYEERYGVYPEEDEEEAQTEFEGSESD